MDNLDRYSSIGRLNVNITILVEPPAVIGVASTGSHPSAAMLRR